MVAHSLWHIDPATSIIQSEEINPSDDAILLTSLYSLISTGTERIVSKGMVPVSAYDRMKVPYMAGDFSFPIKYGYSLIARDNKGNRYHLMHPHQDKVLVDKQSITLLPAGLPSKRASLISNLETIFNAYYDADLKPDDKILIVGYGLMGALLSFWLRIKGFKNIYVTEPSQYRSGKAISFGFQLIDQNKNEIFDKAFHTSSSQEGLQYCIDHLALEGKVIELSWYGDKTINLKLGDRFHYNRLSIISSQVSVIPKLINYLYDFASRKQAVIDILMGDVWDQILDLEIGFSEVPEWFGKIRGGVMDCIGLVVKYH